MKNWNEKCSLFGIWNHREASLLTYFGLYAQQHRGQEGAGIVSLYQKKHLCHKGLGLVGDVFNEDHLKKLQGEASIGHTRYSTKGASQDIKSVQPLQINLSSTPLSLAHNGNFVNFRFIKKKLIQKGCVFEGTSDSECVLHSVSQNYNTHLTMSEILKKSLLEFEGAYCLLILTNKELMAVRDPRGFRPLVLGKITSKDQKTSWMVASETCAFDLLGATFVREIQPGEIVTISGEQEPKSIWIDQKEERRACIFEHVYFSRPDSIVFGESVYEARKKMGYLLAKQSHIEADVVIPVPDSGVASALGFAQASGVPFEMGIVRNHYVGRTFIHPSPSVRNFRVRIKLNPQRNFIKGKRVILVDDSIVRGTTSKSIVKILKQAGAKEIHFRVASPPVIGPCYYGIDTPEKSQLISSQKNVNEIKNFLEVDSIEFLSQKNLSQAVNEKGRSYCKACFTGNYPTPLQ